MKKKMGKKFEIKNKFSGGVIYKSTAATYKDVVEEALENNISLRGSNLYGADLSLANLDDVKFYGKGGITKIKKSQIGVFFKALGVMVEE